MENVTAGGQRLSPNRDWSETNFGHIRQPRAALKGEPSIRDGMAATTDATHEQTLTLTDLEPDLPCPDTLTVDVRRFERDDDGDEYELVVERRHVWIIEVSYGEAELTGVYDDGFAVPKPETVPTWLERVCSHYGIREVTV